MNTDSLRYFVAVAHNKNFSRTAEELFITQSALSRSIRRLEEEMGVLLFVRSRGTVTCELTEVGEACLKEAEAALEHIDNMLSDIKRLSAGEIGSLTIGFSGYEDTWFMEWIRKIHTEYPGIELRSRQMNWGDLCSGILDRSIDVAIFDSGFFQTEDQSLKYVEITDSKLQVIVSKDHPFSGRSSITVDELKDQVFIEYQREIAPSSFDAFRNLCVQHGFSPRYAVLYDSTRMVMSDIYSNRGIGHSVSTMPIDETKFSRIDVILSPEDKYPDSKQCLVYHKENSSACLKNIIQLALDIKKSMNL